MAKKKLYHVERKGELGWSPLLMASYVSLTYAKGYINGMREYYPCPKLRIKNVETGEIKEEFKGNGKVEI